jgi:hypothetical protein
VAVIIITVDFGHVSKIENTSEICFSKNKFHRQNKNGGKNGIFFSDIKLNKFATFRKNSQNF